MSRGWTLDLDSVVASDCRGWLSELPKDSIDLVMTSPPYWTPRFRAFSSASVWDGNADCQHEWSALHICTICGAWKGELGLEPSRNRYVAHLLGIFRLLQNALKPGGSFYLNIGQTPWIPNEIERGMCRQGWTLIDKSTWAKFDNASSSKRKSKRDYELLYHFVKKHPRPLLWLNAETGEWLSKKTSKHGVWLPFNYYYNLDALRDLQEISAHFNLRGDGTMEKVRFEVYSEEFCVRPILTSSPAKGIVIDPFAGSGTTLCVAKRLGRHWLGCDINSAYVEFAKRRLKRTRWPQPLRVGKWLTVSPVRQ